VRLPKPEAGLVVRYSYLWLSEHEQGREEGSKDRPCAIILALSREASGERVLVVPVTHTPPSPDVEAIELPTSIKRRLGLDEQRSWVVLSESNEFNWPGPDLRRVGDHSDASVAFGFLPPTFFRLIHARYVELVKAGRMRRVPRTE
jgi:hypothetical protein